MASQVCQYSTTAVKKLRSGRGFCECMTHPGVYCLFIFVKTSLFSLIVFVLFVFFPLEYQVIELRKFLMFTSFRFSAWVDCLRFFCFWNNVVITNFWQHSAGRWSHSSRCWSNFGRRLGKKLPTSGSGSNWWACLRLWRSSPESGSDLKLGCRCTQVRKSCLWCPGSRSVRLRWVQLEAEKTEMVKDSHFHHNILYLGQVSTLNTYLR